jgi:hypothetical protein
MSTFRELFDQRDRDEIVSALQARLNILEARITKLRNADRATDARLDLDKHEARADELKDLIKRVCAECD